MLDRFDLLKNLLESVSAGIPKRASEEDDFDFEIPLYNGPSLKKPVPIAAPKAPPKPPAVVPIPPVPVPVAPPAPVAPALPPAPKAFPSWVDPTWKPIPKFKGQTDKFDTSQWGDLDEWTDEEPKEAPKPPEVVEPTADDVGIDELDPDELLASKPTPVPQGMSTQEAQSYLESLPDNDRLSKALIALDMADEETRLHPKDKKLASSVLALLTAHFMGLVENADDVFGENKDSGITAAKVLMAGFDKKIKDLPKKLLERTQNEIDKLTGTAPRKLRPLTSQFLSPELIFINNRAIKLMVAGESSVDEAEQTAYDEWLALKQLAKGLIPDNSSAQNDLLKIGSQELLASSEFSNAKKKMVLYSEAFESGSLQNLSVSNSSELFPDVKVDPSEPWEKAAEVLAAEDFLLDEIPEGAQEQLTNLFGRFGRLALEFWNLIEFIERNKETKKDKAEQKELQLPTVYDSIQAISSDLFILNRKYINLAYEEFKDAYIINRSIEAIAEEYGLESIQSNSEISVGQSAGEGLHISDQSGSGPKDPNAVNPRLKRKDESPEDYALRQAHEKELADASRHRYLQNILTQGDAQGYLERKNQYQLAQRPKESTEDYRNRRKKESEINRIRNPEYKRNKIEMVKWKKLAALNSLEPSELKRQVENLKNQQVFRTYDLFKRINESWLPKDKLNEIENLLMDIRIQLFKREFDTIKNFDGINKFVLKEFANMISQIPKYFEEANKRVQADKVSSARITLDMVSTFAKYASSPGAALTTLSHRTVPTTQKAQSRV
jgi:hypothetical protein